MIINIPLHFLQILLTLFFLEQFSMDGTSTLVLEGDVDGLPTLNVTDSASIDGLLIIRVALPPNFSSYNVWHNYTIMKCNRECSGNFQKVRMEKVGASGCASTIDDVYDVHHRQSVIEISVSFSRPPVCFAPSRTAAIMLWIILLLILVVMPW